MLCFGASSLQSEKRMCLLSGKDLMTALLAIYYSYGIMSSYYLKRQGKAVIVSCVPAAQLQLSLTILRD